MLESEIQIDQEGRARVEADLEASLANGFSHGDTLYELGTPLNEIGVENLRKSRQEFEAMPLLPDVLERARAVIATEERRDLTIPMHLLRAFTNGALYDCEGNVEEFYVGRGLPLNEHAFFQLVARGAFPRNAGSFLKACPPELRATNLNHFLPLSKEHNGKPIELLLRTRRRAKGGREIFAALTKWYRKFDVPELCDVIENLAEPGGRAESRYDGQRFELSIVYHTDIAPEAGVVGEVFKVVLRVQTADDGSGAIKIRPGVYRTLCKNMMIIEQAEQVLSVAHNRTSMSEAVEAAMAEAVSKLDFAAKWTESRRNRVLEGIYGRAEVEHVFTELVKGGLVQIPGCSRGDLVERLVCAWEREPGWTQADLVNAISRAAHEEPWTNPWARSALEEQAGQYLYNYVQVAPYQAA
jgi:hypothetical protein